VQSHAGPLIVPQLVIAEVTHFIGTRLDTHAEVRFLADLAEGHYLVEPVMPADWLRIAELVWRYRNLPLGTVDASVVAVAERLGIVEVATLDRRHFSVVRPAHVAAFDLLPELP
jgi:predicted nucleic acid-binding protein